MKITKEDIDKEQPYLLKTIYSKKYGYRHYIFINSKWIRISKKIREYLDTMACRISVIFYEKPS